MGDASLFSMDRYIDHGKANRRSIKALQKPYHEFAYNQFFKGKWENRGQNGSCVDYRIYIP